MENKEKKQMLTTELTKEKSGRSAGMIQDITINGIKLHLAQNGTGGPVIFWGMYPHQPNECGCTGGRCRFVAVWT